MSKIQEILSQIKANHEYYASDYDMSNDIESISFDVDMTELKNNLTVSYLQDVLNDIDNNKDKVSNMLETLRNEVSELEGIETELENIESLVCDLKDEVENCETIEISFMAESYEDAIKKAIEAVSEHFGKAV